MNSNSKLLTTARRIQKLLPAAILALLLTRPVANAWQPAAGPLQTRWAKDVSPKNAHPEYPRPQMVRSDWLNLNGLWDFAVTGKEAGKPNEISQQILMPSR